MDYMTLKEASEKWGVTHQTEQFHILDAINVYSQIGEAGQNTYE